MKAMNRVVVLGAVVLLLAVALVVVLGSGAGASTLGTKSDWSLFWTGGGDTSVFCKATASPYPFEFNIHLTAQGGGATGFLHFKTLAGVETDVYPVSLPADGDTFFASQFVGSSTGDRWVEYSKDGGPGEVVGWVSAHTLHGSGLKVFCGVT
ncbi:MAG: hypothetical protein HYX86_01845 [Chloroflexi bacterium]|nr:hypothetical protein [Chloroflexota bacterium]